MCDGCKYFLGGLNCRKFGVVYQNGCNYRLNLNIKEEYNSLVDLIRRIRFHGITDGISDEIDNVLEDGEMFL